ncbi:MAG: KEOPS complex subunit Pcc1 [Candidatus Thermoplasmatota archaeon]|nr:KEOPS complex subunit Pcc1 [Candidatus Thermoplasmatota archaeon]
MDDASLAQLASVLKTAVADAVEGPVSVAFSGGIDSSLIAMLASHHVEVELLAAGTPGAHDLAAAEESAALLNLNVVRLEISPTQMAMAGHELAATVALSRQEVEFLLPFWLVAREATHSLLLCGQGADELFGGYDRFRRDGATPDLNAEVVELQARLPQREQALARHFGRKVACPFLDCKVIAAAEAFPQSERIAAPGKAPLRAVAAQLGLPVEIVQRPKKAAQYGSGAQKALRSAQQQRVVLTLCFPSTAIAKAVAAATGPDNRGWVTLERSGVTLEAQIAAASVGSLREAAEDFLACAALAAKVAEKD